MGGGTIIGYETTPKRIGKKGPTMGVGEKKK